MTERFEVKDSFGDVVFVESERFTTLSGDFWFYDADKLIAFFSDVVSFRKVKKDD